MTSGPRRARTVDPRIKSPLLYRLSYRPHFTAISDKPLSGLPGIKLTALSYARIA